MGYSYLRGKLFSIKFTKTKLMSVTYFTKQSAAVLMSLPIVVPA